MIFNLVLLERVRIGSWQHVLPILMSIIISIGLIRYAKNRLSKAIQHKVFHFLGCFVSTIVIVFHLYQISLGHYHLQTDLPLYLCSLIAFLIPIFTYYKKFWLYEILLFWILAGTSQGVVTPDIADGFPAFNYFRYWVVHLGLLTIIFYAIIVFEMRPTLKSVFKSYFALQGYVIIIILINWLLDANYFYLNEKPKSASLLDYLGEWPYYIIVVQMLLIPYFLLIYLPFYFAKKRNRLL